MEFVCSSNGFDATGEKVFAATVTMLVLGVSLSGCATVRGMGQDVENTGEWIQRNVRTVPEDHRRDEPGRRSLSSSGSGSSAERL